MKRRAIAVTAIALLALATVVGGVAWRRRQEAAQSTATPSYRPVPVSRGTLSRSISATGNLSAAAQIDVYPEKSGIVDAVLVDVGREVTAGDVLVRLAQDQIDVQQARSNVRQREEELRSAQDMLGKIRDLHGRGAATDKELRSAESSVVQAQDNLQAAGLKLDSLVTHSGDGLIRSAIDGVVTAVKAVVGGSVSPSAAVVTMVDPRDVVLKVTVDENDIGVVQEGQRADVTLDAVDGLSLVGTVSTVGKVGETKSGIVVFNVDIGIDNTDPSARPGMSAEAEITVERVDNAVIVPISALEGRMGRYAVQVRNADGSVEPRSVEVGMKTSTAAEIISGLSAGEVVVVADGRATSSGSFSRRDSQTGMPGFTMPGMDGGGPGGTPGGTPGGMPRM
ncbi:MAG: efflux RND transporter periplasmic adaptor subunit [Firmicutes bacterium]|nr:efflux RND transporter periplasmic adaptor subunit [Bacillota bacterium]